MDDFHSDEHYIYYCEQETLRRNEIVLIINKRVQNTISEFSCSVVSDAL